MAWSGGYIGAKRRDRHHAMVNFGPESDAYPSDSAFFLFCGAVSGTRASRAEGGNAFHLFVHLGDVVGHFGTHFGSIFGVVPELNLEVTFETKLDLIWGPFFCPTEHLLSE
mgnify:CR=1 FL=1